MSTCKATITTTFDFYTKVNAKYITGLNIKPVSIMLSEENISGNLCDWVRQTLFPRK